MACNPEKAGEAGPSSASCPRLSGCCRLPCPASSRLCQDWNHFRFRRYRQLPQCLRRRHPHHSSLLQRSRRSRRYRRRPHCRQPRHFPRSNLLLRFRQLRRCLQRPHCRWHRHLPRSNLPLRFRQFRRCLQRPQSLRPIPRYRSHWSLNRPPKRPSARKMRVAAWKPHRRTPEDRSKL